MAGYIMYAGVAIRTYPGDLIFDVGTKKGVDGKFCKWKKFSTLRGAQHYIDKVQEKEYQKKNLQRA